MIPAKERVRDMKRKTKLIRILALIIVAASLIGLVPASALNLNAYFPDVTRDAWYYDYVMECAKFEIIEGMGDGTFQPEGTLKKGEFIKLLACSIEGAYTLTPSDKTGHWAEHFWNILNEYDVLEAQGIDSNGKAYVYPLIPLDYNELEKPVSRYEMAMLLRNVLYNVKAENTVTLNSPASYIADYDSINKDYLSAVEQAYGKGILEGRDDGSFDGGATLKRCEAAKVIVLLMFANRRTMPGHVTENKPVEEAVPSSESFAFRYRNMSAEERRLALFGNANKTYFTSAADAGSHITRIQVDTWDIDRNGYKYTRTWNLDVNVVVADEVKAIFAEIYNDPERFPIHSLGGARYTDSMRHSWGCAIDINPNENYYIVYSTGYTVGSFCYLNGTSPYCIQPGGSVVRAFAKYGWGWGGSGWTSSADYMHFSILASGG